MALDLYLNMELLYIFVYHTSFTDIRHIHVHLPVVRTDDFNFAVVTYCISRFAVREHCAFSLVEVVERGDHLS